MNTMSWKVIFIIIIITYKFIVVWMIVYANYTLNYTIRYCFMNELRKNIPWTFYNDETIYICETVRTNALECTYLDWNELLLPYDCITTFFSNFVLHPSKLKVTLYYVTTAWTFENCVSHHRNVKVSACLQPTNIQHCQRKFTISFQMVKLSTDQRTLT